MNLLDTNQELLHIVHCAATPNFKHFTSEQVKEWHIAQGWDDIGYHFIIELDGTIKLGRSTHYQGAHCYGKNSKSIGTCLIGTNEFTDEQMRSLIKLDKALKTIYNIKSTHGHNEFSNKECPGINIKELMEIVKWT